MITVSILINGNPVFTRTAVNISTIEGRDEANMYELDTGEILHHLPEQGCVVLAKKMLDTINEAGLKKDD